jgi:hypothetical protein
LSVCFCGGEEVCICGLGGFEVGCGEMEVCVTRWGWEREVVRAEEGVGCAGVGESRRGRNGREVTGGG